MPANKGIPIEVAICTTSNLLFILVITAFYQAHKKNHIYFYILFFVKILF